MKSIARICGLGCALASLLFLAHGSLASAQTCHSPTLRDSGSAWFRTAASAVFATYENSSFTGEYQGVQARAAFFHPRVSVDVALPYYRLVRNGLAVHGLGDLALDTQVVAFTSEDGLLTVGPELALTLPTGNADDGLGMGHVMLMPGGWLKLRHQTLTLIAQVAYGRSATSLSMGGHQHGDGYTPLVNPMNMQELEHALSLAYAVHPNVQLEARVFGALPVHSPMGRTREIIAGGVRADAGMFDVGVEVQVPVVGSPFRARTLLTVAAQF